MRVHRLQVSNFRGIKSMDWQPGGAFVCLIGPGDCTKSTILDAIELCLSPRWNMPFDDNDFHKLNASDPIEIVVTVGGLPDELIVEQKFGLELRGWSAADGLHDEVGRGLEPVLSIRLRVEKSLEPAWTVFNDRNPEGRAIQAKDRERLGCTRLGSYLEKHLTWTRGSVLSRLSGDVDNMGAVLAEAGRAARAAMDPSKLPMLQDAARRAQDVAAAVGISPTSGYKPHLDVEALSVGVGGLTLHDGEVPVRMAGLGTRRLLALGLQREIAKTGGIVLIDEVECGLEPHRLRRLLRVLQMPDGAAQPGQVLLTTHSPTVLGELDAEQLRAVRSDCGQTAVKVVPDNLQGIVRKSSEAMLARTIVVCEGMTEVGLCRGLKDIWLQDPKNSAALALAFADGGGSTAGPAMAMAFAALGYSVAYLGDSDAEVKPTPTEMTAAGVEVVLWSDNIAVEQRLAKDLPSSGLAELVRMAMENPEWGDDAIRSSVAEKLAVKEPRLGADPTAWGEHPAGQDEIRRAIGVAAKKFRGGKGWFKRVDLAEPLAALVHKHADAIKATDLGRKIAVLKTWVETHG